MNNSNKKLKFGRGGKRNRQRRNRMMKRNIGPKKLPVVMPEVFIGLETKGLDEVHTARIDLSGPWNESIAKEAFGLWEASCKTQKEFATEHNFPVSRFRSWKSKIAV